MLKKFNNKWILKQSLKLMRPVNLVGYVVGYGTFYIVTLSKQFSKVPSNHIETYQVVIPAMVGIGTMFYIRKKLKSFKKKEEPVQEQRQENNFDYDKYNQNPDYAEPLRNINGGFGFGFTKEKGIEEITVVGNTTVRKYEFERMEKQ